MDKKPHKLSLSPDPDHLDCERNADWLGNNAAFVCPVCSHVFIVANPKVEAGKRQPHVDNRQSDPGERKCPRCEKSVAHITGPRQATHEGRRDGEAWIEWPV